jgi:hypothetical protein
MSAVVLVESVMIQLCQHSYPMYMRMSLLYVITELKLLYAKLLIITEDKKHCANAQSMESYVHQTLLALYMVLLLQTRSI